MIKKRCKRNGEAKHATTLSEMKLILLIVERAGKMLTSDYLRRGAALNLYMDVTATHCNGCPLDLVQLLHGSEFDFSHDLFGITQSIDRETGTLTNVFLPRCSRLRVA